MQRQQWQQLKNPECKHKQNPRFSTKRGLFNKKEGLMRKRYKKKKIFWTIVMWTAILAAVFCVGYLVWYFSGNFRSEKNYEDLRTQMEEKQPSKQSETETTAETSGEMQSDDGQYTLEEIQNAEFTGIIEVDVPEPEIPEGVLKEAEENPIDFEVLKEINSELYAWIRIPDTNIDYPVAQHQGDDQRFYLHHDMYQKPLFAGCIYTEKANNRDFSDPVTILYGHNMKNGSMFQNLFKFRDKEFFEENKYVYIYTEDKIRVYEIYAAYPYDDRHILTSFDFADEKVLEMYLAESRHPRSMEALVREETEVTKETPVITLSTCIAGQTNQRFLVQAVLMYEEEN